MDDAVGQSEGGDQDGVGLYEGVVDGSEHLDTVVDVGIPSELNMSSSTMSVTMTARKMYISSSK